MTACKGTLNVNIVGKNEGSISVGKGTVILNAKPDSKGKVQAFSEMGIVSGRPILNHVQQTKNHSRYYQPFKQNSTLTQFGIERLLNPLLRIGTVLNHSQSNNDYDQTRGKFHFTTVNAYLKAEIDGGWFTTFDYGIGRSKNHIQLDDKRSDFHRNLHSFGVNFGKKWQW